MKRTLTSLFLVSILAIGGSAFAQTAPAADTAVTAAAEGSYPAGTVYNGVPISGINFSSGALVAGDNTGADGRVSIDLLGPSTPVGQQIITVKAQIATGSRTAANVAVLNGTASVDMGDGTPAVTGIPIVATITTDANNQGTVGVVLGATQLPAASNGDGTMTVEDLGQ